MYNPTTQSTYWYVDQEWNMMQNLSVTEVYDDGHYDAIESTYHAYLAYRDSRFIDGIKSCWKDNGKKLKGQRYPSPGWESIGISRDHTIYSFCAFVESGMSKEDILSYAKRMPFNLGIELGMKMTPSLWLWLRLISGKSIGKLWYPVCWSGKFFARLQNWIADILVGSYPNETPQDDYVFIKDKTKEMIFKDSLHYPTFALKLAAAQLMTLPDSWWKKQINKQALKLTPSENFLLQIIFGGEVSSDKIDNYKPMYGSRWDNELVPERTRGSIMEVITNKEHKSANQLDVDLLKAIYK